jgi:hypothetical protein
MSAPVEGNEVVLAQMAALRRVLRAKRVANLVNLSLRLGCAVPPLARAVAELSPVAGGDRRAIELALMRMHAMRDRLPESRVVAEALSLLLAMERLTATN